MKIGKEPFSNVKLIRIGRCAPIYGINAAHPGSSWNFNIVSNPQPLFMTTLPFLRFSNLEIRNVPRKSRSKNKRTEKLLVLQEIVLVSIEVIILGD